MSESDIESVFRFSQCQISVDSASDFNVESRSHFNIKSTSQFWHENNFRFQHGIDLDSTLKSKVDSASVRKTENELFGANFIYFSLANSAIHVIMYYGWLFCFRQDFPFFSGRPLPAALSGAYLRHLEISLTTSFSWHCWDPMTDSRMRKEKSAWNQSSYLKPAIVSNSQKEGNCLAINVPYIQFTVIKVHLTC